MDKMKSKNINKPNNSLKNVPGDIYLPQRFVILKKLIGSILGIYLNRVCVLKSSNDCIF